MITSRLDPEMNYRNICAQNIRKRGGGEGGGGGGGRRGGEGEGGGGGRLVREEEEERKYKIKENLISVNRSRKK